MKQKDSAILQIFNYGKFENIPKSDEYHDALCELIDKIEKFENQLKDYPNFLETFKEVMNASDYENAVYSDDVYIQAFSFGLAIGQEVFSKKFD